MIMINQKIIIDSQLAMANFAQKIAGEIASNTAILLYGSLGVGKSFFAKNFINSLQEKPVPILSPTFNLVYSYSTIKGEVFHYDLYRLKNAEELENIGFFEAINRHITLIEWPQIAENYLTKNCLKIAINNVVGNNPEAREITINTL